MPLELIQRLFLWHKSGMCKKVGDFYFEPEQNSILNNECPMSNHEEGTPFKPF
jgi:hypothetical protein